MVHKNSDSVGTPWKYQFNIFVPLLICPDSDNKKDLGQGGDQEPLWRSCRATFLWVWIYRTQQQSMQNFKIWSACHKGQNKGTHVKDTCDTKTVWFYMENKNMWVLTAWGKIFCGVMKPQTIELFSSNTKNFVWQTHLITPPTPSMLWRGVAASCSEALWGETKQMELKKANSWGQPALEYLRRFTAANVYTYLNGIMIQP